MKIAVLGTRGFPGVQGGVETHCESLYRRLAQKGCHVVVFMRGAYMTPESHGISGIEAVSVPSPKSKYLEAVVHTWRSVWLVRKHRPDIVHIHAIGPSLLAPLARALGMKVVVTNHGPDYQRKKWSFFPKLFLRFCEWAGTVYANAVIAITESIARDLQKRFHRRAYVIPNGVRIPRPAEGEGALKKFGLDKKGYVLAVGRLVPEKGLDVLVEAFRASHAASGRRWKLVIAGGADFEDKYSLSFKRKVSGDPSVVLTGFLTGQPLHELYSHAGVFALPSYHEGLPIVLLEAMSYGLSCIASDIPANRNVPLSEDRFFKPGDAETLGRKIVEFMDRPLSQEEKALQVRAIAEKYDWEKIADRTLEVYHKVLDIC